MNTTMSKQHNPFSILRGLFLVSICLLSTNSLIAAEVEQQAVPVLDKVLENSVVADALSDKNAAVSSEASIVDASKLTSNEQPVLASDKPAALSVAELKKKVIKLNRDLFILEEDLLFPANTQFVVYLSLDTGKFFQPDSITLKVDDEVVAAHLYTERQVSALARGGMQRLHMGNLKSGEHEVTAIILGQGPDKRDYKQAATLVFEKTSDISSLEIKVKDNSQNYQPSVQIVEWD